MDAYQKFTELFREISEYSIVEQVSAVLKVGILLTSSNNYRFVIILFNIGRHVVRRTRQLRMHPESRPSF